MAHPLIVFAVGLFLALFGIVLLLWGGKGVLRLLRFRSHGTAVIAKVEAVSSRWQGIDDGGSLRVHRPTYAFTDANGIDRRASTADAYNGYDRTIGVQRRIRYLPGDPHVIVVGARVPWVLQGILLAVGLGCLGLGVLIAAYAPL